MTLLLKQVILPKITMVHIDNNKKYLKGAQKGGVAGSVNNY